MTGPVLGVVAVAAAGVLAGVTAGLFRYGNGCLSVSGYAVKHPQLPAAFRGMRVVHLSDLHAALFGKNQERLLEAIDALSPDMVIITGDLIDRRRTVDEKGMRPALVLLEELGRRYETVRVDGNHEPMSRVGKAFCAKAAATPVKDATGAVITVKRGEERVYIVGVPDVSCFDYDEAAWTEALQRLTAPYKDECLITLSHRPQYMKKYTAAGLPLVLSGHAHGGQWRLPFVGGLFAPEQGVFPAYTAGVYREGDTQMVVSRGLGNSGFPLRLFNRPEIVEIVLE